ncbi:MAG: peptide deformylase [Bacteroidales bacterium]|jgi:peptide deformylase|nr:peptide deformylase [Bacteroidales bacterium]
MKNTHIFLITVFLVLFVACQTPDSAFTTEEREFILSGSADEPFRVLQITERDDSLVLRSLCVDMRNYENDSVFLHFIKRLKSTLIAAGGVGIAASQVGLKRNVFLFTRIDLPDEPVVVAINPRIVAMSDTIICFEHDGCLSVVGFRGHSVRYPWIEVEYFNMKGEKITEKLTGYNRPNDFTNIIFQHEYDHTKGVFFTDKLCE